jgi:hypothetical protein
MKYDNDKDVWSYMLLHVRRLALALHNFVYEVAVPRPCTASPYDGDLTLRPVDTCVGQGKNFMVMKWMTYDTLRDRSTRGVVPVFWRYGVNPTPSEEVWQW